MKIQSKIFGLSMILGMLTWSCQDYLDKTPEADVTKRDVFGTYETFQGYLDQCYSYIIDYNSHSLTTGAENGDHTMGFQHWCSAAKYTEGRYRDFLNVLHSNYWTTEDNEMGDDDSGIWVDSWRGIRAANIALQKLEEGYPIEATQEEIDLLKGQAHFFRAYLHWEVAMRWGGLPYVDKVFEPFEDMRIPRLSFQETVECMVEDYDLAIQLLPKDWDQTKVGGNFKGFNAGRATKGAAMAFKAEALLFAGSPLMVHDAGGGYGYDNDYMNRAANAAWDLINMAESEGVYELLPFNDIQRNFATMDGTWPWTKETIFQRVHDHSGNGLQLNRHGRLYTPARFGGNGIVETPTQNLIDMFEMANGYPIDHPMSGYEEVDRTMWDNRDPRLREFILVDGDLAGLSPETKIEMFEPDGIDKKESGVLCSYLCRKFWPRGCNKYDQQWGQFRNVTPHMRLAEVYLIYAEAVNETKGPFGTADGAGMTAVDAVNVVRQRAGMPDVHAEFTGDKETFRDRIWNERSVELCFEGTRWNDIRRWHVAHLDKYKIQYDLEFDKDYTYINRVVRRTIIFEDKHYWMPFPREQTEIYSGWPQNPGW